MSVNLGNSFSTLKKSTSYEAANYALLKSGYRTRIRKEHENILGIEIECSPFLMDDKIELLTEVFGYKFRFDRFSSDSYILMTLI